MTMLNRLITGQNFIDLENKVNAIPNIQLILNRDPSNLCYNPDFLTDTSGWSNGITRDKINSMFVGVKTGSGKIQFGEKLSTYFGDMFFISLFFSNANNNKCDIKLKVNEYDSSVSLLNTIEIDSKSFVNINDSFNTISSIYKVSNLKTSFILFYYQFSSSNTLPVYFTRYEIKKVGFLANYLVSNNIAAGNGLNLKIIDGRNILSANVATLTDKGITSLCDDLLTTDSTKALTASQGKILNDNKLDKTGVAQTALWAAQIAARKIGGVVFNAKSDIDLPGVNKPGNQDTSGNAATATKLQTPVTINNISFDGTSNINIGGTIPIGAIQLFIVDTIPDGWLKANGAEISRTLYSDLFKILGTTYGEGDGKTTFNLPDLRGEFLRIWDDGRGIDKDRKLGSFQDQQLLQHTHGLISWTGNKLLEKTNSGISYSRWFGVGTVYGDGGILYSNKSAINHIEGNRINPTDIVYDSKGADVGNQLIVRNISLLACIKV